MSLILTLNAGSSSLKFALFEADSLRPLGGGLIEKIGQPDAIVQARLHNGDHARKEVVPVANHHSALIWCFDWIQLVAEGKTIAAVVHRIVHGGVNFSGPVLLDDPILQQLRALIPLAPLHQPHNLAGVDAAKTLLPDVPQIACFDTAFHRTQPELAQWFALPARYFERGVRRYGFHGLSYEYIAGQLPQVMGEKAAGRVIVAHLGNGASLCALHEGRSQATSMGFTALDGLMMGTRCGRLDPGVVLHLMQDEGLTAAQIEKVLYKESGLLGVSGISHDMRTLLASTAAEAKRAVDLYCQRAASEISALATQIGGMDALVFTAGIGEHAAPIRERIARQLEWLGLTLDESANNRHEQCIHSGASRIGCYVIPTDEEGVIAGHAQALLTLPADTTPN